MTAKLVTLENVKKKSTALEIQMPMTWSYHLDQLLLAQRLLLKKLPEPIRISLRDFYYSTLGTKDLPLAWQEWIMQRLFDDVWKYIVTDEMRRTELTTHGMRISCPLCGDTSKTNFHGFTKIGLKKHLGASTGHGYLRFCETLTALAPPTIKPSVERATDTAEMAQSRWFDSFAKVH